MKGIVFTELLEMVEQEFGDEVVDHIITKSNLPNGGAYTAVGTYDHKEMVQLVSALAQKIGEEENALYEAFGQHLFQTFLKNYPQFFGASQTAFEFLSSIENHIHVEVKKLYPEAELPRFDIQKLNDNQLIMVYRSERKMACLALGLIEACLTHYKEDGKVSMHEMSKDGSAVEFTITKQG